MWAVGGGAVLIALLARRTLMVVRVEGSSMLPTYADGDRLLAVRAPLTRAIHPDDVVVVVAPAPGGSTGDASSGATETLVKRVTWVEPEPPPGRVFVTGDNGRSYDSRVFGPLPTDAVLGRVVWVVSTG